MKLLISDNCISCRSCVQECPTCIIGMENNHPILTGNHCIKCGHCEAVCPAHALFNGLLNHDAVREINPEESLDPKRAELFLRSRRSIRCFKPEIVSPHLAKQLIDIGRFAQTGSNSQGLSYLVVSSPEKMQKLRQLTLEFYRDQSGPVYQLLYNAFIKADRDILFRSAPMCILAFSDKNRVDNARYALTYIELYAPTLGLGTCWAGYLERYIQQDTPELRAFLELPNDKVVAGALLFGIPKFNYHRLPDRDTLDITWC